MSGNATLQEIDTHYDLCECFDLLEAIDLQVEADRRAYEHADKQHNRRAR